jgi:hypothetical protein
MTDEQRHSTLDEVEQELLKRERRAMRRTAFLIVIPAVLAFALIAVAGVRLTRAYSEQAKILDNREKALHDLGATADLLRADNASLRATAQQCDSKFQEQTALLTTLQQDVVAQKRPDVATLKAVDRAVRESPAIQQSIATTIRKSSERRVARVYLQIADEGQREAARGVQDYLLAQGYNAPGIQKVGRKAPKSETQVRYFDPADHPAAARIAELLQSKYGIRATPAHIRINKELPGQLEIWFTQGAFSDVQP